MDWIKNAAAIIAIAALAITTTSDAATKRPVRRTAPAKSARPVSKPISNTEVLVGQLFLNKYESGENLAAACRRAEFKNLAIALNMNYDLLTDGKGEFETSEEYAQRSGKLA